MYRVLGMDGQVYGPVDLATLQRWCAEGRVAPTSMVIDDRDGRQLFAQSIPNLAGCFNPTHGNPAPQQSTYPQQPYNSPMAGGYGQPTGYGQPLDPYQSSFPRPYFGVSQKNKVVALALAFFLGGFGVHRFYLGHTKTGLVMLGLCVAGFCTSGTTLIIAGVWAFIDMILIATDALVDANGQRLS